MCCHESCDTALAQKRYSPIIPLHMRSFKCCEHLALSRGSLESGLSSADTLQFLPEISSMHACRALTLLFRFPFSVVLQSNLRSPWLFPSYSLDSALSTRNCQKIFGYNHIDENLCIGTLLFHKLECMSLLLFLRLLGLKKP